jgi:hypothetical protein
MYYLNLLINIDVNLVKNSEGKSGGNNGRKIWWKIMEGIILMKPSVIISN